MNPEQRRRISHYLKTKSAEDVAEFLSMPIDIVLGVQKDNQKKELK